jgi:hypothetical protein
LQQISVLDYDARPRGWIEGSAKLPTSSVRTFTDPDAFHAAIRHSHAEGIVSGRGRFRAELTLVRLNRVSLHSSDEALHRVTYSAVDPALFLVLGGLEAAHGEWRSSR